MIICNHIDIDINSLHIKFPDVTTQINVGIITEFTKCKGSEIIPELFSINKIDEIDVKFNIYSDCNVFNNINVNICGKYLENDIFDKLINDKIHLLLFINEFPETYSYAFTKGIKSGLPILYTNIGAIEERVNKSFSNNKFYVPTDNKNITNKFIELCKLIISHDKNEIYMPDFYNKLFI